MKLVQPFILLPFLFSLSLWSATPVPYAGKIDIQGVNYFGEAQFAFSLHDGNGTTHWRNGNQPGETIKVSIHNGRYNVLLGGQGMNSLPPELFLKHDKLFLKVEFDDGDGTGLRHLAPDQLITATPRALVAEISKLSEGVSPGAITRDMLNSEVLTKLDMLAELADGSITPSKIATNSITTGQLSEQILKYLKPEITTQPQAQTVYADRNVSYSVNAEGKYLTYQWKKNGVSLGGETNATLTLTDANSTLHDGNYSVLVSNDFGSVESGVILVDMNSTWETDGLVGWWKFDETNGTVAHDSSGNDNHGTLTSMTFADNKVTGKFGNALNFNGVDEYISLSAHLADYRDLEQGTVIAWIKTTSSQRSPLFTINKIGGSDRFVIEMESGPGRMRLLARNGGSSLIDLSTSALYRDGIWHQIVAWQSGSQSRLYVDGVKIIAFDYELVAGKWFDDVSNTNAMSIGFDNWETSHFNGLIDDVRIFDRALSAAEVQALYNLGQ
jgi:hypothetical protein